MRPAIVVCWFRGALRRSAPSPAPAPPAAGRTDSARRDGRQSRNGTALANIKSQLKRIGTNKKAHDRNKAVKSELRTHVRNVRLAVNAGDKDKAATALSVAVKKLDKAASKGVIHKNQAANRKSAIAKQVASL